LQGETVKLNYCVDPESGPNKGNVEKWLLELEKVQWESIKTLTEKALAEYPTMGRTQWTLRWAAQVILGVSQVFWTQDVIKAIKTGGSRALAVRGTRMMMITRLSSTSPLYSSDLV
jgi:dynein heavy chain, axonemal